MGAELATMLVANSATVEAFVHCAAVVNPLPARLADYAATVETFNVNYLSAQQIVTSLLKKKVNHGKLHSIVFVSSVSSLHGVKGFSLYSASKSAVDGMMRALASKLAPEVRVNSVLPGAIRTRSFIQHAKTMGCLLYTSDAADE